MIYPESSQILGMIKEASRIVLNCHASPDADSVGGALATREVLVGMGKEVAVICPHDIPHNLRFLPQAEKILTVDFHKYHFTAHDLMIALDSGNWRRVSGAKDTPFPDIPVIVIDHHVSNDNYGRVNLVVPEVSSNCELLCRVFEDWGVSVDTKTLSTSLLAGIFGDTKLLRTHETTKETFGVVAKLVHLADREEIVFNLYQSFPETEVCFWSKLLDSFSVDKKHRFALMHVKVEDLEECGTIGDRGEAANMFAGNIKGTDFGMVVTEEHEGLVAVSLRSRTGLDVSKIALDLGGGGHKLAAAGRVEGLQFDQALEKILEVAKNHAQNKKRD